MAAIAPHPTAEAAVLRRLQGRKLDLRGLVFQGLLLLSLVLSLLVLLVLLWDVWVDAWSVLSTRLGDFLTSGLSATAGDAGVWQGIQGTLIIGAFVVVLAFPIGVGAAIYLEEYARDNRFTRFIDVNIRNLAGVPSVVYGILGFAIFVKALGGITGNSFSNGRSLITAGVTLAILVLPIVIITAAEAIRSVPDSLREAGFGVGATRWEVVRSHVLPYAAPGILTGTVLSLARALGETAPLILVGAVTGFLSTGGSQGVLDTLQGRFTALPMIIFNWARQPRPEFREALTPAAIVVLLVLVLAINATAILLRNYYEGKRS